MRTHAIVLLAAAALGGCTHAAAAVPPLRADHAAFIDAMVAEHGFERDALARLFAGVETRDDIIAAITRPAEALPWHRYRGIFLTDARADGGVTFWDAHADTIARAAQTFGVAALMAASLFVVGRGLWIATNAQDSFGRLLAGSLALTFFVYAFVNAGMVSGILPVVGVPLPLFSYGGTAMVTLLAGFGMLMSIHTHRKLISY